MGIDHKHLKGKAAAAYKADGMHVYNEEQRMAFDLEAYFRSYASIPIPGPKTPEQEAYMIARIAKRIAKEKELDVPKSS